MTRRLCRLAAVVLLTAGAGSSVAADSPGCSRVLPGPTFPREIMTQDHQPSPRGTGALASAGEAVTAEVDGRDFLVLQTLRLDLDGDGDRNETVLVEGFRIGFWSRIEIPRVLRRVEHPSARTSIWIQELPPGMAGLIHVEDMDGDGRDDLRGEILGIGYFFFLYSAGFQFLWSEGDEPLTVGQRSGSSPRFVDLVDANDDGVRDLVVEAPFDGHRRTVYPGTSLRTFDEGIIYTAIAEDMRIDQPFTWLEIGDVDGDGLDDALAMTAFDFTDTLAISRGDGTFDTRTLEKPHPYSWPIVLMDFDRDGNLDLWARTRYAEEPRGFYIAWGRGDGSFDPYRLYQTPEWPVFPFLADVDGDDKPEVLYGGVGTVFFSGRDFDRLVPLDSAIYAVADIDDDGRDDVIYRSTDRLHVTWLRSLGDGTFDPPRTIRPDSPFERRVGGVVPTDVDGDDVLDLFVKLRPPTTREWRDAVLRGSGDATFELIWQSTEPFVRGGRQDVFADIDADGRPDLVSYEGLSDFDTPITHEVRIRRGNGLGFDEPMEVSWLSFAGKPGRFREGRTVDMLRIGSFGNSSRGERIFDEIFQLELNPSLGHVLPHDSEPPTVELRLLPAPDQAEDRWRVATLPLDDCSSSPRVTDRRIVLLDLPPGSLLTFRPAARIGVTVVEDTASGIRAAVIQGPDRRSALAAFREARREGGFPFAHMASMTLRVDDDYGPPVEEIPGVRQVQQFVLEDGVVAVAWSSYPGADLWFRATAEDGVQSGFSSGSFLGLVPRFAP